MLSRMRLGVKRVGLSTLPDVHSRAAKVPGAETQKEINTRYKIAYKMTPQDNFRMIYILKEKKFVLLDKKSPRRVLSEEV